MHMTRKHVVGMAMAMEMNKNELLYNQKIWLFGSLSYLLAYIHMTIPYQTAKLSIRQYFCHRGPTAKFNSCQYFPYTVFVTLSQADQFETY